MVPVISENDYYLLYLVSFIVPTKGKVKTRAEKIPCMHLIYLSLYTSSLILKIISIKWVHFDTVTDSVSR